MTGAGLIVRLWKRQPGKFFCVSVREPWFDQFFERDELNDVADYVRDQKRADKDVYFCPHGFDKPRRVKAFAVLPKLLWADLDEADPHEIKYEPSIALESSPGRFVGLWRTDEEVTEELNCRMTRAVGADKGGWALTKVLRFPGTRNRKYKAAPLVKVLWTDGPRYEIARLELKLPKLDLLPHDVADIGEINPASAGGWQDVTRRYRLQRLNMSIRQPAPEGKRSDVIYRVGMDLIERGATPNEVAAVLLATGAFKSKWGTSRRALVREVQRLFARSRQ